MRRDEAIQQNHGFIESRIALASALEISERPDEAHEAIGGFNDVAADYVERHVVYAQEVKDCVLKGLSKAGLPK